MILSKYKQSALNSPFITDALINTLQVGVIPDHIAFIMDGNRRYSRLHGIPVAKGHFLGSRALMRVRHILDDSNQLEVLTINFIRSSVGVSHPVFSASPYTPSALRTSIDQRKKSMSS